MDMVKVAFWFIPRLLRQVWRYEQLPHLQLLQCLFELNILSINPVQPGRIHRVLNSDPSSHGASMPLISMCTLQKSVLSMAPFL